MLNMQDQPPILAMLTIRDDLLPEHPDSQVLLQALEQRDDVLQLPLGPLAPAELGTLLRGLLRLEPSLAGQVAARSGGNPLFAVALIGDWIARGLLVLGDDGFRLRAGTRPALPSSIHEVWSARVDNLLEDAPPQSGHALELVALLGDVVDRKVWADVCEAVQVSKDELLQRLQEAQLAVPALRGWQFGHGMLRESLIQRAREGGRLRTHHATCATILRKHSADPSRLGTHLLRAGQVE